MTTIILVSIGVLIAAAAALMIVFYGGSAFGSADVKSEAARLVGEGVQIQAAYQAFKAQEDRTPGGGTGVDAKALKEMICQKYLTHIPRGIDDTPPPSYDAAACASDAPVSSTASPWKIDYNYGIARSVVGSAEPNADGSESRAVAVCQAARRNVGLTGSPKRCDPPLDNKEPCCIMSKADADA